ncbi:MAG: hypothetical protein AAF752_02595 [Bacteroidota bacterium]
MNATLSLPTPLKLGTVYRPAQPSTWLNVLGAVGFCVGLLSLVALFSGATALEWALYLAIATGLGAWTGLWASAGTWHLGNGQNAFELTEDGFVVTDKRGQTTRVLWRRITKAVHVPNNKWSFRFEGRQRGKVTISETTHDEEVMRAFSRLVYTYLPPNVRVQRVDPSDY